MGGKCGGWEGKMVRISVTIYTVSCGDTCTPYILPQCWTKATANYGNINSNIHTIQLFTNVLAVN